MIQGIGTSLNMSIAQRSLDACVLRQEALASNIANVETPGYKRMDVAKDFADRLKTAVQRSGAKMLCRLRGWWRTAKPAPCARTATRSI